MRKLPLILNIAFPSFNGKTYQIQLTNLNGQIVSTQTFAGEKINLDVSNLTTGLYLVKLITANQIFNDKLMIQR